jgi:hypothetical protein
MSFTHKIVGKIIGDKKSKNKHGKCPQCDCTGPLKKGERCSCLCHEWEGNDYEDSK